MQNPGQFKAAVMVVNAMLRDLPATMNTAREVARYIEAQPLNISASLSRMVEDKAEDGTMACAICDILCGDYG